MGRAAAGTSKIRYKIGSKPRSKTALIFDDFLKVLGVILGGFWEHFAVQKPFKFDHDFGMLFCRSTGRGAALTRRRRAVDAPATGVPVPRIPLGGAPFRARRDPINA